MPLGIAAFLQASIYDVPGGYRAVMFDRFSGVKDRVELLGVSVRELRSNKKARLQVKELTSLFPGYNVLSSTIVVLNLE